MHERRVAVAYAAALIMMLSAAVVLPQQARAQLGLPLLGSLVVTVTSPAAGSTVSGTRTVSASVSIIGGSSLMRLKSPSESLPCAALPAL